MQEPVQYRRGNDRVAENRTPVTVALVRGQQDTQPHMLPGNDQSHFPRFREMCSGNYQSRGNGKTARGIDSADPSVPPAPGTESPLEIWSADRTAPEQVSQALGLREVRLAESQQILPLIGNRKCSSRRRSCPGGERGDRQSSVPADSNPSRASPTGRRIGGYDYKTESFQRPRVEHYTRFREIRNSNFLVPPPLGVGVFGKLPAARKRKDRQRNRLGRSQQAPASPRN